MTDTTTTETATDSGLWVYMMLSIDNAADDFAAEGLDFIARQIPARVFATKAAALAAIDAERAEMAERRGDDDETDDDDDDDRDPVREPLEWSEDVHYAHDFESAEDGIFQYYLWRLRPGPSLAEAPYCIARNFCGVLARWLDAEELRTAVMRNRAEQSAGVCHSHDFCDANMAMDEAFTATMGRKIDLSKDPDPENNLLWNQAWEIAKAAEFDASRVVMIRAFEGNGEGQTMREVISATTWIAIEHWTEDDRDHTEFLAMRETTGCGRDCADVLRAADKLCVHLATALGEDETSEARATITDAAVHAARVFYYG